MFAVSGIILNHRNTYGKINVSRKYLPSKFQYTNWNNGLLRGTICLGDSILVYGAGGIYLTDSLAEDYYDFNAGLPESADSRNIRSIVQTPNGHLFAAAPYDLYTYTDSVWTNIPLDILTGMYPTRLNDLTTRGDTLVVLSRNELLVSLPPYNHFQRVTLKQPADYNGKVTLFRVMWLLHSGELFGLAGKIITDILAAILILLSVTGIAISLHSLLPQIRRFSLIWHERLGRWTIILTLLLCITGWALRPPLLIALVKCKVSPIPGTILSTDNPWNDKLRMIRWDNVRSEWLLSTSEGFFTLSSFSDTPQKDPSAPPVSVMGINVLEKGRQQAGTNQAQTDRWIVGSFSGLFVWDRQSGKAYDYYTGEPAPQTAGAPFGKLAVSGYTDDFPFGPVTATYYEGAVVPNTESPTPAFVNSADMPQPDEMRTLPISLWSLALEVHTGRIYTFMMGAETLLYIFIAGIAIAFILWSGWKLRKRHTSRSHSRT